MSDMIPQPTIDALRQYADLSVQIYGIDVTLFIPQNKDDVDENNIYTKPSDYIYASFPARIFIEWKPNMNRLRKMGIFSEADLPIIGWMKFLPDVVLGSYIQVPVQYTIPNYYETNEFEIVDNLIKGTHDAVIVSCFKLAPRRVKLT